MILQMLKEPAGGRDEVPRDIMVAIMELWWGMVAFSESNVRSSELRKDKGKQNEFRSKLHWTRYLKVIKISGLETATAWRIVAKIESMLQCSNGTTPYIGLTVVVRVLLLDLYG